MIYSLNHDFDLSFESKQPEFVDQKLENANDIDGVIIRWFGEDESTENFIYQAILVNYCVKNKKPIFIFDPNSKLKNREFDWIYKNTKSYFAEPYILTREGFNFLPEPINVNLKYEDFDDKNDYEHLYLVSRGKLTNKEMEFRNYYVTFFQVQNDAGSGIKSILYEDAEYEVATAFEKEFLQHKEKVDDMGMGFAIDTESNYHRGHIDPVLFGSLQDGCLMLLPEEHRFLYSIFGSLVAKKDISDLHMFVSEKLFELRAAYLDELFSNIRSKFPEFSKEYSSDVIKKFFGG